MADTSNVNANADVAYNATNRSRYFNLPLFVSGDKPSWLVDWNGAIGAIDEALETLRVSGEGDHADILTIQTTINTINDNLETAQSTLETATEEIASIAGRMTSAETDIDGVQSDLIAQNTAVKTMQTTVSTMQTTVSTLQSTVSDIQNDIENLPSSSAITALESRVSALDTKIDNEISSVEQSITTLNNNYNSLDGTVDNLSSMITALVNTHKVYYHSISNDDGESSVTVTIPYSEQASGGVGNRRAIIMPKYKEASLPMYTNPRIYNTNNIAILFYNPDIGYVSGVNEWTCTVADAQSQSNILDYNYKRTISFADGGSNTTKMTIGVQISSTPYTGDNPQVLDGVYVLPL